jgi:tetratricopeptide (TPR) repeat protein
MARIAALLIPLFLLIGCSADDGMKQFYSSLYLNEGNYFYNGGKFDKAIERYSRAIELDPEGEFSFNSYYFRAFSYYNKASYASAIKDFTVVIGLDPKQANALIARGNCYALKKLYTEALADFDEAIRVDPTSAYAYFNKGNVYSSMGDNAGAFRYYAKGIAVALDFFEDAYLRRGELYGRTGAYALAIEDLTRVIDHNTNNRAALIARKHAYEMTGKAALAREDEARIDALNGALARDYLDAAALKLENSDIEGAIHYYTLSLELDPTGARSKNRPGEIYIYRGQLYFYSERYAEAADDFKSALRFDPKNWMALSGAGVSYARLKFFGKAEIFLKRSLQLNPTNDLTLYNLGKLYSESGKPSGSVKYFTLYLELDPEQAAAYAVRGDQYFRLGEYKKAANDYTSALDLGLKNDLIYLMRANAYAELRDYPKAIRDYSMTIALTTNAYAGYLGRANAFRETESYSEAVRDYRRYLELTARSPSDGAAASVVSNSIAYCEKKIAKVK